jgi:hypothetical protein
MGTHLYSQPTKDRLIVGGEHILTGHTSVGTQYMIRKYLFEFGPVWHVFTGGMWLSAHTDEHSARSVLRRVGIKL